MPALPVKNFASPAENTYGVGPWYTLNTVLLGAGAGNAPTVPAVSSTTPPGSTEIVSIVRNSAGNYTVTLADTYYAVISWNCSVDDVNGSTPFPGPQIGQFKNTGCNPALGTPGQPMIFTLTTYNTAFANADLAAGTPIRIQITFKKDFTGASA